MGLDPPADQCGGHCQGSGRVRTPAFPSLAPKPVCLTRRGTGASGDPRLLLPAVETWQRNGTLKQDRLKPARGEPSPPGPRQNGNRGHGLCRNEFLNEALWSQAHYRRKIPFSPSFMGINGWKPDQWGEGTEERLEILSTHRRPGAVVPRCLRDVMTPLCPPAPARLVTPQLCPLWPRTDLWAGEADRARPSPTRRGWPLAVWGPQTPLRTGRAPGEKEWGSRDAAPRPQRAARGPCKPRRPRQALLSPVSLAAGITGYQRDCLCRCASRKVQSGLLARGTAVWAAPRGPEPQQSVAGSRPELRRRRGGGGPGAALGHLPSPNMSPSSPTRPAALPSSPGAVSLRSTPPAEPGIQPGSRARAQGLRGPQAPRTAALDCRPPPRDTLLAAGGTASHKA